MGSTNKKTILLSKASHEQLCQLAEERGQTLGELIRQACARAHPGGLQASGRERRPVRDIEESDDERLHRPS